MNILLITHFFPPKHNAGTENYTLGLAQAFLAKGHRVYVLCAEDWSSGEGYWNGVTEDVYLGVPVIRIHLNWTKAANPNHVLFESLPVEQWLDQYLQVHRPDIVHVTSTYSLGVGILRSARRARIPLVLTLMDFWFLCPRTSLLRGDGELCDGRTTPWECQECLLTSSRLYHRTKSVLSSQLQPVLWYGIAHVPLLARRRGARGMALDVNYRKAEMRKELQLPNVIISHSAFVQKMIAQAGLSQRVIQISNGLDLDWAANYQGKSSSPLIRFGYMGQITKIKGVHLVIQAFQQLRTAGRARLDIWGDFNREPAYGKELHELIGNDPTITLRGRFQRAQLATVLADIDILIVPSMWYENAPLVILEAFVTQTPVIATNLGGMAESVQHEVTGLLFKRGDAADLSKQMARILGEPNLLAKLKGGIQAVKSVEQEVLQLEEIYANLLADPERIISDLPEVSLV
ncbi:MAG: glycosyltransferase family 4 protein [Caldilineaceae bacterium]